MKATEKKAAGMVGKTLHNWTIVERIPGLSKSRHAKYLCRCVCGTEKIILGYKIRRGESTSCGCTGWRRIGDAQRTHGMTSHRLYKTWSGMMARCYNPSEAAFADYGARGITVCERWHDVRNFIADNQHLALPGLTIDRRHNDWSYSPENTRWATRQEQKMNRRNTIWLTHNGHTKTMLDWAKELKLPFKTLWWRVKVAGWSDEKVLTTPIKKHR